MRMTNGFRCAKERAWRRVFVRPPSLAAPLAAAVVVAESPMDAPVPRALAMRFTYVEGGGALRP